MSLIIDIELVQSENINKARIDSVQILHNEKRSIVTTTEGYLKDSEFIPVRKGKTFIFKDVGVSREFTDFIQKTSLDENSLQQHVTNKYTAQDASPEVLLG